MVILSSHRRSCLEISRARAGMTLVEVTVALAIVVILGVIVVQSITWSMSERARLSAHHAALELAENALESARAMPWEKLDQSWADSQKVPDSMVGHLPEGRLTLTVQALDAITRQVTAQVEWQFDSSLPPQKVQLTTVLSARSLKSKGGMP